MEQFERRVDQDTVKFRRAIPKTSLVHKIPNNTVLTGLVFNDQGEGSDKYRGVLFGFEEIGGSPKF